jgi:hypothetical protein
MLTEFAVLILLALGGAAIAWQLGIRNLWLSVPAGLMITVVVRDVLFATMNMVNQRWIGAFALFGILALGLIVSAWQAGKGLYKNLLLGTAIAVLAVISTRLIGFTGTPHGDSLWILSFAHLFDINGNIAFLNGHTAIKRGFSYPLLLSLGPSGQYLSGITPFIYGALCSLIVWAVRSLLPTAPRKRVLWGAVALAAITLSTVMPLRAIFYINGHTLTAVGMLAAAVAAVVAVRDYHLSRENLLIICLGAFTASTSRVEGIVMIAIIVLPLLAQNWLRRREIMWIISSATVGLSIWLSTYHSYIIHATHLPWYVFSAIFVGAGLLPALKIFDWIRVRIMPISLYGMLAIFLAAEVVFHTALRKGNQAIYDNLLGGSGRWGWAFVGLVVLLIIGLRKLKDLSAEHRILLWTTSAIIVGSLLTKMLDGGQFGHPTLGRTGWSDSLNRMWLQSFAIFLVTALVGLVQNEKIWGAEVKTKG